LEGNPSRPKRREIKEEHPHIKGRGLIGDLALGLSDGVVTNLALLAGFAGAMEALNIIRFAGLASMVAGAVSMFFGGLMAGRAEHDLFRADQAREAFEIEHEPEEEKSELKEFYMNKGLTSQEADIVVKRVTSNKEKWLEDLMKEELALDKSKLQSPFRVAGVVGLSFLIGALMPLVPYFVFSTRSHAIIFSVCTSLLFLFIAGGWKGRISGRKFWRAGLEMFFVGAVAAAVLYIIGTVILFV